jgi:hypothetical protein
MIATSGTFRFGLMVAAGLALAVQPRAGHAYSPEQQQACTPDAMRLCGPFVPDVDRITACMSANRALLSPPCRMYFRRGPEPVEIRDEAAGRPMALRSGERKARVGKFRRSAKPQQ